MGEKGGKGGPWKMADDDVSTVIYEMLTLIELHRLEEAMNNTSNCYCLIQLNQTWEEMASDLLKNTHHDFLEVKDDDISTSTIKLWNNEMCSH